MTQSLFMWLLFTQKAPQKARYLNGLTVLIAKNGSKDTFGRSHGYSPEIRVSTDPTPSSSVSSRKNYISHSWAF